jgi:hypothetical protein
MLKRERDKKLKNTNTTTNLFRRRRMTGIIAGFLFRLFRAGIRFVR